MDFVATCVLVLVLHTGTVASVWNRNAWSKWVGNCDDARNNLSFCYRCAKINNETECLACFNNYVLENGICKKTCSEGYHREDTVASSLHASTKFTNPTSGKCSSSQSSTTDGDAVAWGRITSNDKMLTTGNISITSAGIKTVVSSFMGITILKTDGTTKTHSTNDNFAIDGDQSNIHEIYSNWKSPVEIRSVYRPLVA